MDDVSAIYQNCEKTKMIMENANVFEQQGMKNNIQGMNNKSMYDMHHFQHSVTGFRKLCGIKDVWEIPWFWKNDLSHD